MSYSLNIFSLRSVGGPRSKTRSSRSNIQNYSNKILLWQSILIWCMLRLHWCKVVQQQSVLSPHGTMAARAIKPQNWTAVPRVGVSHGPSNRVRVPHMRWWLLSRGRHPLNPKTCMSVHVYSYQIYYIDFFIVVGGAITSVFLSVTKILLSSVLLKLSKK